LGLKEHLQWLKLTTDDTGKRQREEAEAVKGKVTDAAEMERGLEK